MTTSENRRKALSDAIDKAIRAWAQRFGNKPDFEPDSEICFCTAVVLGCFIARCSDEQRREYLLKEMQTSLNDAVDIGRALRAAARPSSKGDRRHRGSQPPACDPHRQPQAGLGS